MPITKVQLKKIIESYDRNRGSAWMGGWDSLDPQSIKNAKALLAEVKQDSLSADQTARLVKCFADNPPKSGHLSEKSCGEVIGLFLVMDDKFVAQEGENFTAFAAKECLEFLIPFIHSFLPQLSKEGYLSKEKIEQTFRLVRDVFLLFYKLSIYKERLVEKQSFFKQYFYQFLTAKNPNLLGWFFIEMCHVNIPISNSLLNLFIKSDFYFAIHDKEIFNAENSVLAVAGPCGTTQESFALKGGRYRKILREALAVLVKKIEFEKNFHLLFPIGCADQRTQEEIYELHEQATANIVRYPEINSATYRKWVERFSRHNLFPYWFIKYHSLLHNEHYSYLVFVLDYEDWRLELNTAVERLLIVFDIMQKLEAKSLAKFCEISQNHYKIMIRLLKYIKLYKVMSLFLDVIPHAKEGGNGYLTRWLEACDRTIAIALPQGLHQRGSHNQKLFWEAFFDSAGNNRDQNFISYFEDICNFTSENHDAIRHPLTIFLTAIPGSIKNLFDHRNLLLTRQAVWVLWARLPPNFRFTQQQWQGILDICQQHNNDPNTFSTILEEYVVRMLNAIDAKQAPNTINTAQSIHTASVHKTVSESASRLMKRYSKEIEGHKLEQHVEYLSTWVESLKSEFKNMADKNLAAKRCLQRLLAPDYSFMDTESQVSIRQLLVLLWIAIHDDGSEQIVDEKNKNQTVKLRLVSKEDALNLLVEALYEIQRGYNLSDKDVDDKETDNAICASGTFSKLMEKLNGKHRDIQMKFITPQLANFKLPKVVKEEVDQYFALQKAEIKGDEKKQEAFNQQLKKVEENGVEEIWKCIVDKVTQRMLDEFGILYKGAKDPKFVELIKEGKWAPLLDLKKWTAAAPALTATSAVASMSTSAATPATSATPAVISQATAQPQQPTRAALIAAAENKDQKSDQKTPVQHMRAQQPQGGAATASQRAPMWAMTMFSAEREADSAEKDTMEKDQDHRLN